MDDTKPCDPGPFGSSSNHPIDTIRPCIHCHTYSCPQQAKWECAEFFAGVTTSHCLEGCPDCGPALKAARDALNGPQAVADPDTPALPFEDADGPAEALRDPGSG